MEPFTAVDENDEMLDDQPYCQAEPDGHGTLCDLPFNHTGNHLFT